MNDKVAVNTNMAQKFADNHNMPVFETSAKDDAEMDHVEAIFLTLAHKLKTAKPLMPPPSHGGMSYNADSSRVLSIDKEKASHSNKADRDSCSC
jgi:Ras-related protein Rab-33B